MTAIVRWISIAAPLLLTSAIAAQQAPSRDNLAPPRAAGTASLSGIVINALTNAPLRRAIVTLSSPESFRETAITNDAGAFSFRGMPAGRYSLGASKPGYVGVSFGATRPNRPGTTISLAEGQQLAAVRLPMPPGAVITGTVRNRNGEPVPGARVAVLRSVFGFDTGERTLAAASIGLGPITDDRGVYRVFGLAPDDYYVVVSGSISVRSANELRETTAGEVDWATRVLRPQSGASASPAPPAPGRAVDYAPVFYPGAFSQAGASTISVKAGEERAGVDVLFDLIPTAKVTGTVVSPDGALPQNLQVNVIAHDTVPGVPFSGFGAARVDKDGRFVNAGLPPGDYTITVRVAGPAASGRGGAASALFGLSTITVSGGDVDTSVRLESGVSVSGRLAFDGNSRKPPDDLSKVRVNLTAVRGKVPTLGVSAVNADAGGSFTFAGVTPGRYRLAANVSGWVPRSAMWQGRDTLDQPIEIGSENISGVTVMFTDRLAEISGDLLDAAGHPAPEYSIVVFPADKAFWTPQSRRIQSVRPASDGHFRAQNLPAGDYFIAAVTDVEQGEWYDPSFLAQLVAASTKVTLADGETKTQSLKIKSGGIAR